MIEVVSLDGLTRFPVGLRVEGWRSTPEATRIPVHRFREWLTLSLTLELAPEAVGSMLVALVMRTPGGGSFARIHRNHSSTIVSLDLKFRPVGWDDDEVEISLGMESDRYSTWVTTSIRDGELKADPRHATTAPTSTVIATTGTVWTLAELDHHDVVAQAVVLARRDTIASHGRWRLKPEHAANVPEALRFLLGPPRDGII